MLKKHIKFFTVCCFLAESTGSVCLHWDRQAKRLSLQKNFAKNKKRLEIKTIFHALLIGILFFGGLHKLYVTKSKATYPGESFLFGFAMLCMIWLHVLFVSLRLKASTVCQYVNGIFHLADTFKQSNSKRKLPLVIFIDVAYAYMTCYVYTVFPFCFVYGLHWLQPCKSSLMGYWLLPECSSSSLCESPNSFVKLVIFLINHWMWSMGFHAGALGLCGVLIMCTVTMWEYLNS